VLFSASICAPAQAQYSSDVALEHRLLVFPFRRCAGGIEYLFERRRPTVEFDWTPLPTEVGPTESLLSAALRLMRGELRAPQPQRWVELNVCDHQSVGDLDLIDWGVGYGVPPRWDPRGAAGRALDFVWRPLTGALELLERDGERRALFRLHVEAAS